MKTGAKIMIAIAVTTGAGFGCSSVRSALALNGNDGAPKPIRNPFDGIQAGPNGAGAQSGTDNLVLRSKRGDGSVEVEIPRASEETSDFIIPVGSSVSSDGTRSGTRAGRGPASVDDAPEAATQTGSAGIDDSYLSRKPSMADREITRTMPRGLPEDDSQRNDIEQSLGLVPSEDGAPRRDRSYLASIDHVKQLYRTGRFEAGLLETDELIKDYPTDPRLFQMRGTLFERLGQRELALKAWKQALRFEPNNLPLRRFIDRRETATLAAGGAGGPAPASVAAAPIAAAPTTQASTPAAVPAPVPAPGSAAEPVTAAVAQPEPEAKAASTSTEPAPAATSPAAPAAETPNPQGAPAQ